MVRVQEERGVKGYRGLNDRSTLGLGGVADAVADAWLCRDEGGGRAGRIGDLELVAQPAHVHVQVMGLTRVRSSPHGPQQAALREEASGLGDHGLEQLVFARREIERFAADRDTTRRYVEPDRTERDRAIRGGRRPTGPAK